MADDDQYDINSDVRAAWQHIEAGGSVPDSPHVPLTEELVGTGALSDDSRDGAERVAGSPRDETSPTTGRSRDARGRYATETDRRRAESLGVDAAQQDVKRSIAQLQGKEPEPEQPAPVDHTVAPSRLNAAERAEWNRVPPSIQRAWLAMEQNTQRGVEQLKQRHQEQIQGFEQSFAPLRGEYQKYGYRSDADALRAMSAAHMALVADPVRSIATLIQQSRPEVQQQLAQMFGVGQQQQHYQQPQYSQQQIEEMQGLHAANAEITEFARNNKYFEHVRSQMANILTSGRAESLDDAYKLALSEHPMFADWQREKQIAAKRRAANASLSGAPHGAAPLRNGHIVRGRSHFDDAAADVRDAIGQLR